MKSLAAEAIFPPSSKEPLKIFEKQQDQKRITCWDLISDQKGDFSIQDSHSGVDGAGTAALWD